VSVQYLVLRVCKLYTRSTVASLDCVISYIQVFCRIPDSLSKCQNIGPIYIIIIYIRASTNTVPRVCIDSRVSQLRTFQLIGTLPYTGFTFDSPKRQSYIYILIYICATEYCILIYRSASQPYTTRLQYTSAIGIYLRHTIILIYILQVATQI
jgi:hypothetical protein